MTDLLERIPPQSIEAEQAALGAILLERRAIERAMGIIQPPDFYREAHRHIFAGAIDLYNRNEPVDIVTLGELLKTRNQLDAIGGTLYLTSIMNMTPTAAGIDDYCEIIRRKSQRRALIRTADEVLESAYTMQDNELDDTLIDASGKLDAIRETGNIEGEPVQLADWVREAYSRMRVEDEVGEVSGIDTHLDSLNRVLQTQRAGYFILVAGRPSMGKSVLAMNWAVHAAMQGKHVAFYSEEMDPRQLALRAVMAHMALPRWKLETRGYRISHPDETYDLIAEAVKIFDQCDFVLRSPKGLKPNDILIDGRQQRRAGGLDAVFVDYLQLMRANDAHRETIDRISAISRELKHVAVELRVPLIAVSQLSRECEKRSPLKRPQLSDLRDSGQLEQDADAVMLVYRPGHYGEAECRKANLPAGDKHTTEIIVAKQREGPTGETWTYFDLERSRIVDRDTQHTF